MENKKHVAPLADAAVRPVKVGVYVVCGVLVLYYCLILWWGVKPNVGLEYKMYYITHELSDWCGYGNLKYVYGTKEVCITRNENTIAQTSEVICARKGQGFGESTLSGTAVTGEEAFVYYLPERDASAAKLLVEVSEFDGDGVSVYAGEKLIGTIDNSGNYTFDVGSVSGNEILKIRFENGKSSFTLYSLELDS
jgi:hypothetical protein